MGALNKLTHRTSVEDGSVSGSSLGSSAKLKRKVGTELTLRGIHHLSIVLML